ncbi:cytochrome c oxidase assembly protein [Terriglobus sp.]|uniref:cytochrome c oxidase assembly protein n=1 Tax=Terriglobus sp. TaxID=1889013 RepID=UPI003B00A317
MHDAPSMLVPVLLTLAAGASYLVLAIRQHAGPRGWSLWRIALFLTGCGLLILGLSPRALPYAEGDFRRHMLQHLLLAMGAPIGLVMAAPVTLLLRTLPSRYGRVVTATLRTPVLQAITHPVVALVLDLGGMAGLYFTALYTAMMQHPVLHYAVHFHFIAAGCLYTWVIAGPDPAPHRPSVPVRLAVLGAAVVIHSVLSQLLYAGWHFRVATSVLQRHGAAELMYYGGDITEMLLAFAMVSTWHPRQASPAQASKACAVSV